MLISISNSRKFKFLSEATQLFLSILIVVAYFIGTIPKNVVKTEAKIMDQGITMSKWHDLSPPAPN